MRIPALALVFGLGLAAAPWAVSPLGQPPAAAPAAPGAEPHLTNIRQITFGGENAEAYFSFDGKKLIFQATPKGSGCDQIFGRDLGSGETRPVSTGAPPATGVPLEIVR